MKLSTMLVIFGWVLLIASGFTQVQGLATIALIVFVAGLLMNYVDYKIREALKQ